jgi:hypothetical protein
VLHYRSIEDGRWPCTRAGAIDEITIFDRRR